MMRHRLSRGTRLLMLLLAVQFAVYPTTAAIAQTIEIAPQESKTEVPVETSVVEVAPVDTEEVIETPPITTQPIPSLVEDEKEAPQTVDPVTQVPTELLQQETIETSTEKEEIVVEEAAKEVEEVDEKTQEQIDLLDADPTDKYITKEDKNAEPNRERAEKEEEIEEEVIEKEVEKTIETNDDGQSIDEVERGEKESQQKTSPVKESGVRDLNTEDHESLFFRAFALQELINEQKIKDLDQIPDKYYEAVDPLTDMAYLGNGKYVAKFYPTPRLLDETNDIATVRPGEWNTFHESPSSRLNERQTGYEYDVETPFGDIEVSAGLLDISDGKHTADPRKASFKQGKEENATLTVFGDVYPGIDVEFRDLQDRRYRSLVIREKPTAIGEGDTMIFWEEYRLPEKTRVLDPNGKEINGKHEMTGEDVLVQFPDESVFAIGAALIFDASEHDLSAKDLSQIVVVDRSNQQMRIGIQVPGEYLLADERKYPVTIDPSYNYCKSDSSSSCSLTDLYLRYLTSRNTTLSNLYIGYNNAPDGHATRHPVVKFTSLDPEIPSGSTIDFAGLRMYGYSAQGNGTYNGSYQTVARKITDSWSTSSITYNNIRWGLETISGSQENVSYSPGTRFDWTVTSAVDDWVNDGDPNYGLLVEPTPTWTSGSAPAWQDRLYRFYSSRGSTTQNPYLRVEYTAGLPNLVRENATYSATTVEPGDLITFQVDITNVGASPAGTSYVYYYFKSGTRIYENEYRIGTDFVSSLDPGESSAEIFSFTVPSDTSPGTYYFYYWVDALEQVSESSESNKYVQTITVEAPAEPDLRITLPCQVTQSSTVPGGSIDTSCGVFNDGPSSVAASSRLGYYLSGSSSCSSGMTYLDYDSVGSLDYEEISWETESLTIPAGTSPGSYYICFVADYQDVVDESNEGNNTWYDPITVLDVKPDLTIPSASLPDTNTHMTGDYLDVTIRFQNIGGEAAPSANYEVELDDQTGGPKYYLTGLSPSAFYMNAGYDNTITIRGRIPDDMPLTGTYDVDVTVDPDDLVDEENEFNNNERAYSGLRIDRRSYGGGGGGGAPTPESDYDGDGFRDAEEKFSGYSPYISESSHRLYSPSTYTAYYSTPVDSWQRNYSADPVNTRTGAFEFTQTDIKLPGRGVPIDFARTYNSKTPEINGRFGLGWSENYKMFAYRDRDTDNVQVYKGGAQATVFTTSDSGATYVASGGVSDVLTKQNVGGKDQFTLTTIEGTEYRYTKQLEEADDLGILEQIVDTNNNVTQFSYTDRRGIPLLSTITDPGGRTIDFTYGDESDDGLWDKVVSMSDAVSGETPRVTTYTYDSSDPEKVLLMRVDYTRTFTGETSETFVRQYTYDEDGQMLTYTDPRGTVLTNTYDAQGRAIRQDINGQILFTLAYTSGIAAAPGSTACTVTRSYRDASVSFTNTECFDANGFKIYMADELGNIERWAYDESNGMPTSYTDANGNVTAYTYDDRKRKTSEQLPDTATHSTVTTYQYEDTFNRLTRVDQISTEISSGTPETKTTIYTVDPATGDVTAVQDPLGNTETFVYDSFGNVTQKTDRNGDVAAYTYDPSGNYLTQESITVTQADGTSQVVTTQYGYNGFGHQTSMTTPNGQTYAYEYDNDGNLRVENLPLGHTRSYRYDLEGNKITEIDELGNTTAFVYDDDLQGSLLFEERIGSGGPLINAYTYDALGNILTETDPRGNVLSFSYDNANRIIAQTDPFNTVGSEYDAAGNVIRQINSADQVIEYTYDARNNLLSTTRYASVDGPVPTDPITVQSVYDGFDRLVQTIDGNGNTTSYTYDLNDQLLTQTDAAGEVTTYTYDANGNQLTAENRRGFVTTFHYDGLDRQIRAVTPMDTETLTFYDPNGNVVRIVDRQNTDGTGDTHETTFTYDARDRLTQETDSLGHSTSHTYDAAGNRTSTTDRASRTTTYTYDAFSRLLSETDPATHTTTYAYDKNGNRTSITYPDTTQTTYIYDAMNRLTQVTDELDNSHFFFYDAVGNNTSETDKNSHTTTYTYDGLNRLAAETNAQGTITNYVYDSNNRLSETVDDVVTSYTYDALDRLTQITNPGDKTESFEYDEEGNLTRYIDGESRTNSYVSDQLNRRIWKERDLGDGQYTTVRYTYDNWDNITKIRERGNPGCPPDPGGGGTPFCTAEAYGLAVDTFVGVYDTENRLTSETRRLADMYDPLGDDDIGPLTVTRTYHADGRLDDLTDAAGKIFSYNYDTRGLLQQVTHESLPVATYTYTAFGKPTLVGYGSGFVSEYTYDELQRVDSFSVKDATDAVIASDSYTYDGESNRLTTTKADGQTYTFTYDELDQLTSVDDSTIVGTSDLAYTYDARGNRLTANAALSDEGSQVYHYDTDSDELVERFAGNGRLGVAYTYDGNGSVLNETYSRLATPVRSVNYTWDYDNQLREIRYTQLDRPDYLPALPDSVLTFAYDDNGNRIKKTVNGESTYYYNSGLSVLNEVDDAGAVTTSFVAGLESSVAEVASDGSIIYNHTDVLGSTVVQSDSSGNVVSQYEYDPFGEIVGLQEDAGGTDYLFTGQEYDVESNLYYYNARYYDPALGRFLSRDMYRGEDKELLSRHRYIYVQNNPLRYVDPTGLFTWKTFGKGVLDLGLGVLETAIGGIEMAAGAALALGGSATGVGAIPSIAGGTALGTLGANSVVSGGSNIYGGFDNIIGAFKDEEYQSRNFNPAHELIDATVDEGGGNTAAHLSFIGVDFAAGGFIKPDNYIDLATYAPRLKSIGGTGEIGEDALKSLGGMSQQRLQTSMGPRIIDQLVDTAAFESKVGYTPLTRGNALQISKDKELLQTGAVSEYFYQFTRSPITNQIGPSGPMSKALTDAGIGIRYTPDSLMTPYIPSVIGTKAGIGAYQTGQYTPMSLRDDK